MQVMVVEDTEEMRLLLEQLVNSIEGWKASFLASNVTEARLELTRRKPDLMLLDEVLPGESAYDFLKEVTSLGVRVVLLTGMDNPDHSVPDLALGRIQKPDWNNLDQAKQVLLSLISA